MEGMNAWMSLSVAQQRSERSQRWIPNPHTTRARRTAMGYRGIGIATATVVRAVRTRERVKHAHAPLAPAAAHVTPALGIRCASSAAASPAKGGTAHEAWPGPPRHLWRHAHAHAHSHVDFDTGGKTPDREPRHLWRHAHAHTRSVGLCWRPGMSCEEGPEAGHVTRSPAALRDAPRRRLPPPPPPWLPRPALAPPPSGCLQRWRALKNTYRHALLGWP
jgi:hypothetical protein